METTVLGYPRIGGRRELKKATEAFWAGRETAAGLAETAAMLRRQTWEALRDAGLSGIPSNTFSLATRSPPPTPTPPSRSWTPATRRPAA